MQYYTHKLILKERVLTCEIVSAFEMLDSRTKPNNFNNNTTSTFTSSILNNIVSATRHSSAELPNSTEEANRTVSAALYNKISRKQTNIQRQNNIDFSSQCRTTRPNSGSTTAAVFLPTARSPTEFLQISDQQRTSSTASNPVETPPSHENSPTDSSPKDNETNRSNRSTMGSVIALLPLTTQRSARRLWRIYLQRLARVDVCIVLLLILCLNVAIFSLIFVNGKNNQRTILNGAGNVLAPVMPPFTQTAMAPPLLDATASENNNSVKDISNIDDEDSDDNVLPMPKTFDDFETLLTSLELDHDVPVGKIVSLLKTTIKGGDAERNMLEGFMSGVKCMRSLSTGTKCEKPDFFQQIHDAVKSSSPTVTTSNANDEQHSMFSKASQDLLASMNINNVKSATSTDVALSPSSEKQKFEQFKSVWLTDMGPILLKQFSNIKMTESKIRALLAGLDAQMLRQYVVPFLPTDRETLSRMVTTLVSLTGLPLAVPEDIVSDAVDFLQHVIIRMKQGYVSLFSAIVQEKLEEWMIQGQCRKVRRIFKFLVESVPAGYGTKLWESAKDIGLQPLLESFTKQAAGEGGLVAHDQLLQRLKSNMTQYDTTLVETQWISSGGWNACLLRPLAVAGIHLFGAAEASNWSNIEDEINSIAPEDVARYIETNFSAKDPEKYARATLNYSYRIDNNHFCRKRPSDVLLMVFTPVDNRPWRDAVRETFAQQSGSDLVRLSHSVLFVLGVNNERPNVHTDLVDEQKQHGDVIQIDVDDRKQNANKFLAALQWFATNCVRQQYVMKVEENVFINTDNLMSVLEQQQSSESFPEARLILGQVHTNAIPVRTPFLSTFVSMDAYGINKFPPFLDGDALVIHTTVIHSMLHAATQVPLLSGTAESEFVSGILPSKAAVKSLMHITGFATPNIFRYRPNWCDIERNVIVIRNTLSDQAIALWRAGQQLVHRKLKCA